MLGDIVQAVRNFASSEETKLAFEETVLKPCAKYADEKLASVIRMFQVVAVLVFIQTIVVMFLLFRDTWRR